MFLGRTGRTVELEILQYCSLSAMHLLIAFLESDPRLHCFWKLNLSRELGFAL